MNNILVPTDFSATASKAFQFALFLAKRLHASVLLCHVYTPVESTFIGTEEERKQHNEETRQECYQELEQLKTSVASEFGEVAVKTCVERTPLVDNLIDSASKHGCQLIVMGTQGATGMKKVVIGSVASSLAEDSTLPVLLVPEAHELHPPEHIVFATNFKVHEAAALEQTIALAAACKARLSLVHVCPSDFNDAQLADERMHLEAFAKPLQEKHADISINYSLLCGEGTYETLEHLEKQMAYDILVIVRREKGFLEGIFSRSLAKNMAYATSHPLLVFPAAKS